MRIMNTYDKSILGHSTHRDGLDLRYTEPAIFLYYIDKGVLMYKARSPDEHCRSNLSSKVTIHLTDVLRERMYAK